MPKRNSTPISPLFSTDQELVEFFDRLPRAALGEGYTKADRAHDFIQVFNTSDAGQRVLTQILDFCRPFDPPAHADSHGRLAYNAGRRYVLGLIIKAFDSQGLREVVKEESADA